MRDSGSWCSAMSSLATVLSAHGLEAIDVFDRPDGQLIDDVDAVVVGSTDRWDRTTGRHGRRRGAWRRPVPGDQRRCDPPEQRTVRCAAASRQRGARRGGGRRRGPRPRRDRRQASRGDGGAHLVAPRRRRCGRGRSARHRRPARSSPWGPGSAWCSAGSPAPTRCPSIRRPGWVAADLLELVDIVAGQGPTTDRSVG